MNGMNPTTRMKVVIFLCGILLFASFVVLIRVAYLSDAWTQSDTIAVSMGIVVALTQVLLVYAWIEPSLASIRQKQLGQDWKNAVREFLALCSMSARDLSFSMSYHIEETNKEKGVIVLRHGIVEALNDISGKSTAFDAMARLCSNAFSDDELAILSEVSADLRSCAENASSAAKRLQIIEGSIRPFDELDEDEIRKNTYRRADIPSEAQGVERHCYWLVRDIDEIFEPMIEACRALEKFAFETRYDEPDPFLFVEGSRRYQRALKKERKLRENSRSPRDLEDKQHDGAEAYRNIEEKLNDSVDAHRKLMKKSIAELEVYNQEIEAHGICIAWLPDEPQRLQSLDNETNLRA